MKTYLTKDQIQSLLEEQITPYKKSNEYIIGFLVDDEKGEAGYNYKSLYFKPTEKQSKKTFIEAIIKSIEESCKGLYDITADVMVPYIK